MRRVVLLAFVWGWSFLFIKIAVEGFTPPTVAALRIGLGAATLLSIMGFRRLRFPRQPAIWLHFLVTGLFASALPFTALAWGEQRISTALTSVLNATTPLFTAALAAPLNRERLRASQIIGLLAGVAGVSIAAGVGRADLASSTVAGVLAAVLASACYGLAFTWVRRHLSGVEPLVAAAGQLSAASLVLVVPAVWTSLHGAFDPTWGRLGAVAELGVLGTGLAMLVHYGVVRDLGPTRASLSTYLVPIVAVIVGAVLLDEHVSPRLIIGGVIVVGSVAAANGARTIPWSRLGRAPSGIAMMVALLVVTSASCSSDDEPAVGDSGTTLVNTSTTSGVGSEVCEAFTDPVDPASLTHVVAGGPEPTYLTEPPTSGPHDPRPIDSDTPTEPIARPRQVGALEGGQILVQYRPEIDGVDWERLLILAGDGVIVAPNSDIADPVVATAWTHRLVCPGVSDLTIAAIDGFTESYRGAGAEGHD